MNQDHSKHYTYDDYAQWEGRWELIYGIAYAMTPAPSLEHQDISFEIGMELHRRLAGFGNCKAYMAVDWQISDDTVVQPDNLVVCGEQLGGNKLTQTPLVIFEVLSPATSKQDKTLKRQLYEQAGVRYYCIVDWRAGRAEVFALENGTYIRQGEYENETVTFELGGELDAGALPFDFAAVFK